MTKVECNIQFRCFNRARTMTCAVSAQNGQNPRGGLLIMDRRFCHCYAHSKKLECSWYALY